jgi:transposase
MPLSSIPISGGWFGPEYAHRTKENGLNPMGYLTYLLGQLPNTNFEANPNLLDNLMPWSQKLPDSCLPVTRRKRD